MKIPYRKTAGGIMVEVKVEPRASKAGIQGIFGDIVKVKLTSPPVGGAANKQLVELLSKELRVGKRSIKILKGERSKNKLIKIEGIDSI